MTWEWNTIATRPFGFFRSVDHPAIQALAAEDAVFFVTVDIGVIDKNGTLFKFEMLRAIGDALDFPSYYGINFDALDECIRELTWIGKDKIALCLLGCRKAWREHYSTMTTLLEILNHVEQDLSAAGKSIFAAFVD